MLRTLVGSCLVFMQIAVAAHAAPPPDLPPGTDPTPATVHFPGTGLDVVFPDDGSRWSRPFSIEKGADMLMREAPSTPRLVLGVRSIDPAACARGALELLKRPSALSTELRTFKFFLVEVDDARGMVLICRMVENRAFVFSLIHGREKLALAPYLPLLNAIVAAAERTAAAPAPQAAPTSPAPPATLHFPTLGLDVRAPTDGLPWGAPAAQEGGDVTVAPLRGGGVVLLVRDLNLETCMQAQMRNLVRPSPDAPTERPPETFVWMSTRIDAERGTCDMAFCTQAGDRALGFAVRRFAKGAFDLAPFAPLVTAITDAARAKAAAAAPAPVAASSPGPDPNPPRTSTPGGVAMLWFELEVPTSWRDAASGASGVRVPSPRAIFPGLDFGTMMASNGFIFRMSLAWAMDLMNDELTSSPRYGGQHWEALLDFGYGLTLGDWGTAGLALGWHGLSGPITKNSSVAASLYVVASSGDDLAFMLRVTPVQLFAANERNFLSPLTIEARLTLGTDLPLSFGLEGQWIDEPEPGDEDIVGRAFALIFRFGYGLSGPL